MGTNNCHFQDNISYTIYFNSAFDFLNWSILAFLIVEWLRRTWPQHPQFKCGILEKAHRDETIILKTAPHNHFLRGWVHSWEKLWKSRGGQDVFSPGLLLKDDIKLLKQICAIFTMCVNQCKSCFQMWFGNYIFIAISQENLH